MVGFINRWQDRWFVITKYGVGYIKENEWDLNSFREFAQYTNEFQIILDYRSNTITLIFKMRSFEFWIQDDVEMIDLLYSVLISL